MNDDYLNKFKPLEVVVSGDFDQAAKIFKNLVNRDGVLSEYKERQKYEKPSVKKRRKAREARDKRLAYEHKMKLIQSGEWDRRMKKKMESRQRGNND